jgi:acetylornithine/succinyldiaminopimelate/putrescine aminotransferase
MVLLSPIDWHDMAKSIEKNSLDAIKQTCESSETSIVMDHSQVPPMGGGQFFVHDSITSLNADAVILSAGLLGGIKGGILVLGNRLASSMSNTETEPSRTGISDDINADINADISNGGMKDAGISDAAQVQDKELIATLAHAALKQWIQNDWLATKVDNFPVELAQRLATFETIRDLHVTGRTIGIEMDVPSSEWIATAKSCGLRVCAAGEFAIALQPPLVMDEDQTSELLDRIVHVFETIAGQEQEKDSDQTDETETTEEFQQPIAAEATADDEDTIDAETTVDTGAS